MSRPPLWGNFVGYADNDMLAFGLLAYAQMGPQAFYHATQATEKCLKALCLSIIDPIGATETACTQPWMRTHNLVKLANRCSNQYVYYAHSDVLGHLRRFAEFDQVARCPWLDQLHGNGFSSTDIPVFGEICCHLRNDLPILVDDYQLGIEVRGYHHKTGKKPDSWSHWSHQAVEALRQVLPKLDDLVRW